MLAEDVGSSLAKFKKSNEPAKMLEVWKDLTVNQASMFYQLVCSCFMVVFSTAGFGLCGVGYPKERLASILP